MPIYEYECQSCFLRFDIRRGFHDDTSVNCPRCNCQAKHVFSPVPIIFKGSGFYVTDTAAEKHSSNRRNGENKADSKGSKESKGEKVS